MFSCLNYGNHNKVLPYPSVNTPSSPRLPDNIKLQYYDLQDTAIIRIEGMGTNSPSICKSVPGPPDNLKGPKNVHFVNVTYASRGMTRDAISLRSNSMSLRSGSPDIANGRESQRRLFELINKIKMYLTSEMNKVIVIGVSHGSLLVHAAFLKLQMDIDLTPENLSKLHIYTIGSPRYLPKGLLPEGRLLNFYHVKDKMIRLVNMLPFGGCKVPDLQQAEEQLKRAFHDSETSLQPGEHLYDPDNAIVYVNKRNFQPDNITTPVVQDYYYMPISESRVSPTFDLALFHAYPYILYPIMDFNTRYAMSELTFFDNTNNPFKLVDCHGTAASQGGANKKQHIKYQNKVYKIRKDKVGKYITIKKVKTYLKEIRGKYRYTTKF